MVLTDFPEPLALESVWCEHRRRILESTVAEGIELVAIVRVSFYDRFSIPYIDHVSLT